MLSQEHQQQRHHGQVVAAQAQRKGPHRSAHGRTEYTGDENPQHAGKVLTADGEVLAEIPDGVRPQRNESGVAQRHLTGVADEQVHADGTHGVNGGVHTNHQPLLVQRQTRDELIGQVELSVANP